jgi:phosphatidylinositol-3-phosphatase
MIGRRRGLLQPAVAVAPPPRPTVTNVNPNSGPVTGGTSVTVTGTNFLGATLLRFGTQSASFVVNTPTSIIATSPGVATPQTVDIIVTLPSGQSSNPTTSDQFQYTAVVSGSSARVMIVPMENEDYANIIGNSSAPFWNNTMLPTAVNLTNYFAIGHSSLPNYLGWFSGQSFAPQSDSDPGHGFSGGPTSGTQTIINQLETAGIFWKVYAESMPSAGYTGSDTGNYAERHVPMAYFPAITGLGDFTARFVPMNTTSPFAPLIADLNLANPPQFVWVTPNLFDDGHTPQSVSNLDNWLSTFIPAVQATSWYSGGGKIIVVVDEDSSGSSSGIGNYPNGSGGGQVACTVVSATSSGKPTSFATAVNHVGLLRSVEELFGLPYLSNAANAGNGDMLSILQPPPSTAAIGWWAGASSAYPGPKPQQIYNDFGTPGGGGGSYLNYTPPSNRSTLGLRIMLAVGMIHTAGTAATIGNTLVSNGFQDTIFRIMIEQNTNFNHPWNQQFLTASQYITEFQAIVADLRAVAGNNFKYVWCPNGDDGNNLGGRTTPDTWPGAAFVDYVGSDIYDFYGGNTGGNINEILTFANGGAQAGWPTLATAKPLVLGEWGLNGSGTTYDNGQGATFMTSMINLIQNNNYVAQAYFSFNTSSPQSDLDLNPHCKSLYVAAF